MFADVSFVKLLQELNGTWVDKLSHYVTTRQKCIVIVGIFWPVPFYFLVRQKTKDLMDFIQDDDKLRDERKKAKKNKDKYIGLAGAESEKYRYSKSSW